MKKEGPPPHNNEHKGLTPADLERISDLFDQGVGRPRSISASVTPGEKHPNLPDGTYAEIVFHDDGSRSGFFHPKEQTDQPRETENLPPTS